MTTVHPRYDNRILNKECSTLADKYDVYLIVADGKGDELSSSVKIIDAGEPKNRFDRIFHKTLRAFSIARSCRADVYHIHDPELLPMALLYRTLGKKIIYDIHEDYITSVMIKEYLPEYIRKITAVVLGFLEKVAYKYVNTIIAERYYHYRFPNATPVLNYPVVDQLQSIQGLDTRSNAVIYTGNVTYERGASALSRLSKEGRQYIIRLVGKCTTEQKKKSDLSGGNLEIVGLDRYVSFPEIVDNYRKGAIAGLALFPYSPHYVNKELTKFFEYMAVGLPIIASDFPVWRDLIEGNGVGFCVDSCDVEAVIKRIEWLEMHPEKAEDMGARGKQLANDVYNWNNEANTLLDFYAKLL